jgi:amino acid transporter
MGGDYVYLTRAFGPFAGFQFGWAQLAVILTSSTGMMGFVFGEHAVKLFGIAKDDAPAATVWFALGAIGILAAINLLGVVLGKATQNILSLTKVLGLGGIILAGLIFGQPSGAWQSHAATDSAASFGTALILVLYAYGGWNDAAFVAAEMRNRRDIPTTLILGTAGVMLIYLLVNVAYIQALGFPQTQGFNPTPIAARTLERVGGWASSAISILVMISALGAINGLLFAGSRVCAALGADHSAFETLGRWNRRLGSPVWSILALAGISMAMVLAVGTKYGRDTIDQVLTSIGLYALPWDKYFGGFDTLFAGTAPVFWLFFLLTGLALFVLRRKDPHMERPFRVPAYPVVPLIFCGMCIFGMYSALVYAKWVALIGLVPLLLGIPLYWVSRHRVAENG